ncbi:DAO-domain-containing protein [Suillus fuscotomentosus]|uniref:Glycerol-3-phosphate dehydrogenase n=1 Tax=Suillus fuscotomentosus TaxID=1912939 RepID=A0AAD4E8M9_9AGAM|nr:DAO-domain-containing protein [Suillus fuscotomentosus]KAG1901397.1 DAO-domain-containing protein [Suillus fuscotomentosus]
MVPRLRALTQRTLTLLTLSTATAAGAGYLYLNSGPAYPQTTHESRRPPPSWSPPPRATMIDALKRSTDLKRGEDDDAQFDILVVGGGATGAGVAVDAASRGLRVALVEREDFASGTSSKSTKLVHGGVRYLQKAVLELDYEQYKLVREALRERRVFLQTAPYLSHMLPIMLPIYKYWQVPYYWSGCKFYDLLAGKENMESSYLMSKGKALEQFPMLKSDGLVGAVVYYDGQHNDSRMNLALILTAIKAGATVANYCGVTSLHKDPTTGLITGARVKDYIAGGEFDVRAKIIINATGPYSDSLLSLSSPTHKPIVRASSGVHIALPSYYAPKGMGLLDPATSDGRVVFFLPWEGGVVAGTTDEPYDMRAHIKPQDEKDAYLSGDNILPRESEVQWVMDEVRGYLSGDIKVRRGDVLSAWSGLRPLISSGAVGSTEGLVRSHVVKIDEGGMVTIAGGKWTTYRAMAEEAVDEAIKVCPGLRAKARKCQTQELRLVGSEGWDRNMFIGLIQRYGLHPEVAQHLSSSYGSQAWTLLSSTAQTAALDPHRALSAPYPFTHSEITYALTHEYAQKPLDVLLRRTRLGFVDARAALGALPEVVQVMGDTLGWDTRRRREETRKAEEVLRGMGAGGRIEVGTASSGESWLRIGEVQRRVCALFGFCPALLHPSSTGAATYPRALFQPGEIEVLREVFGRYARVSGDSGSGPDSKPAFGLGAQDQLRMPISMIREAVQSVAGLGYAYEGVRESDFRYVLREVGLSDSSEGKGRDVDFEEFVEICGDLKDVSIAPAVSKKGVQRRRIPVEKSGGGV